MIVAYQLTDAKAKESIPTRVDHRRGHGRIEFEEAAQALRDHHDRPEDPQRPEVLAVAQGRDEAAAASA